MIGIGFGIIVAVAVGVGASVLITWASGLRPLFAMLVGLVIVLTRHRGGRRRSGSQAAEAIVGATSAAAVPVDLPSA